MSGPGFAPGQRVVGFCGWGGYMDDGNGGVIAADVKVGKGAFMKSEELARQLAENAGESLLAAGMGPNHFSV